MDSITIDYSPWYFTYVYTHKIHLFAFYGGFCVSIYIYMSMVFYIAYMCFKYIYIILMVIYIYIYVYTCPPIFSLYMFIHMYTYISICVHMCVCVFFHMIYMLTAQAILNAFSFWFFNDRTHRLPIITFFHMSITFGYI